MFDTVAINRSRKKRIWERCPVCDERLDIPVGRPLTLGDTITAAMHVSTERHQRAAILATVEVSRVPGIIEP